METYVIIPNAEGRYSLYILSANDDPTEHGDSFWYRDANTVAELEADIPNRAKLSRSTKAVEVITYA